MTTRRKHPDEAEIDAYVRAYQVEGAGIEMISQRYQRSIPTIRRHLAKRGVYVPPRNRPIAGMLSGEFWTKLKREIKNERDR
jgi:hypothetical protein